MRLGELVSPPPCLLFRPACGLDTSGAACIDRWFCFNCALFMLWLLLAVGKKKNKKRKTPNKKKPHNQEQGAVGLPACDSKIR